MYIFCRCCKRARSPAFSGGLAGALVGPSQVSARVVEMLAGRYYQPIWTMVASTVLVGIGTGLLLPGFSCICDSGGAVRGWKWHRIVARGTLPLKVFGLGRYPIQLLRRLGLLILMSMALSPVLRRDCSSSWRGRLAKFAGLSLSLQQQTWCLSVCFGFFSRRPT